MPAHRRALDAPHGGQHRPVSVAELGEVLARALDVGEEEGQLAGRQLGAELPVDEPDGQDAVTLRGLEQPRAGAIACRLVLEEDAVEARQGVADVGLVVDRQAPPSAAVDVRERAVGQLRAVALSQFGHRPNDRRNDYDRPMVALASHTWSEAAAGGPGETGTVVLVHGVAGWHRTWWRVGPALARAGWRVVAVDLRGHGNSPPIGARVTVRDFADDLAASIERMGAPADAVIGPLARCGRRRGVGHRAP